EDPAGGLEVAVIGGGNADGIDAVGEQRVESVGPREAGEIGNAPPRGSFVTLGARPGPAGDGGQLDIDQAEVAAIESLGMQLLEQRAIGLVKDHAQADHAGPELVVGQVGYVVHADMIAAATARAMAATITEQTSR